MTLTLAWPSVASAELIGFLSFDGFLPEGTNSFSIANFTGSSSSPPDFPVVNALTFLDAELSVDTGESTLTIPLGDIGAGFFENDNLVFPDSVAFLSATLTFTLSTLLFAHEDGTAFQAASSLVSVSLLPSAGEGEFLSPGLDFVVIDVAGTPVTSVPEPSTVLLFGTGVLASCSLRKRRMKAS